MQPFLVSPKNYLKASLSKPKTSSLRPLFPTWRYTQYQNSSKLSQNVTSVNEGAKGGGGGGGTPSMTSYSVFRTGKGLNRQTNKTEIVTFASSSQPPRFKYRQWLLRRLKTVERRTEFAWEYAKRK